MRSQLTGLRSRSRPSADHLACLPNPGGDTLAGPSGLKQGSVQALLQGAGSPRPSFRVFGQQAFAADLVPRPEALTASFFFFFQTETDCSAEGSLGP